MSSVFRDGILSGRTAVISGGGSGINLGIAKRFASQGADVVIVGRTAAKLAAACLEIAAVGGGRAAAAVAQGRVVELMPRRCRLRSRRQ